MEQTRENAQKFRDEARSRPVTGEADDLLQL